MSEAEGNRFLVRRVPYSKIMREIGEGRASRIDPGNLSSEIREHGVEKMPKEVVAFLCDHLEGKIEKRGRKGSSQTDKRLKAQRAALIYSAVRNAQHFPNNADENLLELIEETSREFPKPIAGSEAAWRIVSCLLYGNDGHHRKLANLVSKHAPLKN